MTYRFPQAGDRVEIRGTRFHGRHGTVIRMEWVRSGQDTLYPVVRLDRTERAAARVHRFAYRSTYVTGR